MTESISAECRNTPPMGVPVVSVEGGASWGVATIWDRKSGEAPATVRYPALDTLAAELSAFADAVEGKRPFPVPEADVLATLGAFEAALRSMQTGQAVACQ